jgi:2-oxoisovalerate dehydrogenase E2 component (dihydrolipoyl transacylase)
MPSTAPSGTEGAAVTEHKQFRLPDVGEGLTEADIVSWHVKPGDEVIVNQVIVEIETAKAVVELPSPFDGVVAQLLVAEGQTVAVGTPIIAIAVAGSPGAAPAQPVTGGPAGAAASPAGEQDEAGRPPAGGDRQAVLVGYGVKAGATTRRRRKTVAPSAQTAFTVAPAVDAPAPAGVTPELSARVGERNDHGRLAKPPVRKLARDLGIDLSQLSGTGPHGTITRDDIARAVQAPAPSRPAETGPAAAQTAASAPPAARAAAPREERVPVRGVRKHVAEAMVASAFTAPHVTEFLDVDVSATMEAVQRVRELPDFSELRVSPLLFVARALLVAVARHPMINSVWDGENREIVVRNYVNLGVAAATERGLIVPNIKDAHALSMPGLARALAGLTATARDGRCTPADLTGGTITITNVGVLGVDAGTPILTPGEAAILAFGRIRDAAWVHGGEIAVRNVTTLSLSFDHRIVDGELGSAVLRDVGQMLEDPVRMLAWA